jgi:stage V sporulation protein B
LFLKDAYVKLCLELYSNHTLTQEQEGTKLMEKALKMGKVSAVGGFQLFVGKSMSTVIMTIGTIVLARLMAPAEYGLYSIALVPSMTITLFHDWGIRRAMAKYIAHYRAIGKDENISDIIAAGLIFKVITGVALSFLSLFLANFIATIIFNRPEIASLISIASIAIISNSLLTASQSSFTGFEKMKFTSLTLICQAIIKSSVSPILVLVGYGTLGAVLGYTSSFLVSAILGLTLLYFILFKNLKKSNSHLADKIKTLKKMLRYGVPLSISTIVGSFLIQFYAFLMAFYCSDVMIGNYQVALNFSMFLTFFTFPIGTVLFPAFSKLDPKSELQLLRTVFASAVKYAALFLVPATMITIVLSEPMVGTLFGQKWVYAPFFLTLYVIQNLFVLFGVLILSNLLAGIGETKLLLKLSLLNLSLGIPLAFILIPTYGIVGVILGTIFAGIPGQFLSLYWLWKHYNAKPDFKISAKIFLAAVIATIATYLSLNFLAVADWIRLAVGGTIFLAIYLFVAPIIGAISQKDTQTLRAMFSGLGVISKLINIPLNLAEKATALKND